MDPFDPGDPKAPRGAWKPMDEPTEDRPDDRRTLEVRGGVYSSPMDAAEDEAEELDHFDERDTVPPPLPVAEYVQTMMQQADTDEDPEAEPPASRSPHSWRGEPPSSHAPHSWRGEPRAPHSWRARGPLDSPASFGGLRALDPVEGAPTGRPPRGQGSEPGSSSGGPRSRQEDDEFERRPLSLRGGDAPRSPVELDPWMSPPPRAPLEPTAEDTSDIDDILSALRTPTQPSLPRPQIPRAPISAPARNMTPQVISKPSIGLSLRKPSAPAMAAVVPGRPLPPPPLPKAMQGSGVTTLPRLAMGKPSSSSSSITRPLSARPPDNPADDAEIDALPFDDLLAASHRSVPPPTVIAPVLAPKAPVPAGLRLGKEPLSSFPPVLEDAAVGPDVGGIPAILDVAWAFGGSLPEDEGEPRHAMLPGVDLYSAPTAFPPSPMPAAQSEDDIPAILDAAWVFPKSSYDEANEVTTIGSFEHDLDLDLDLEPVDEIQARFDEGDFAGALLLAERILAQDPTDARARISAESARERLVTDYSAELGGRRQIPHVTMSSEEIRWLSLDHRAGFLLSCVDGRMTIEEILDVSTMAELDALRILCDLRERNVISMDVDQARSTRR